MKLSVNQLELQFQESGFSLALDQFECSPGDKIVICGESGCGKSTLLNLFSGILSPGSGSITYQSDQNVFRIGELTDSALRHFRLCHIGLVYQNFELIPYLTLLDNILLKNRLEQGFRAARKMKNRAIELAREAGLEHRLYQRAVLLSQGEKQRTALCRALLNQPELLFADEPTANLDPASSEVILEMIETYRCEQNALVLMVSHSEKVLSSSTRTLRYQDGRFVEIPGGRQ